MVGGGAGRLKPITMLVGSKWHGLRAQAATLPTEAFPLGSQYAFRLSARKVWIPPKLRTVRVFVTALRDAARLSLRVPRMLLRKIRRVSTS